VTVTSAQIRTGIRLGVDVGSVRVGVARSDPAAIMAVPVRTIRRTKAVAAPDLAEIVDLVVEYEPIELIVGLPVQLNGTEGLAAESVRSYVQALIERLAARGISIPVRLVDERLTTAVATRGLREAGRDARSSRPVIDQAAAVVIVQDALDAERRTGTPPGMLFTSPPGTSTEGTRTTS
jgi:putative Holliday junction resolvase